MTGANIDRISGHGLLSVLCAIFVVGFVGTVYGEGQEYALLLQQDPPDAGTVTPAAGVHSFEAGATVVLTAVPKPGYQFVCWLGDVSDPTSSSTFLTLDAPKIVIGVFEQTEFGFMVAASELRERSTPIGGAVASGSDYARQGFMSAGGRRRVSYSGYEPPEEWEWPDFPVPEEGDEFPVPEKVPEPATVLFLLVGGLFVDAFRRTKHSDRCNGAARG